MATTYTRRTLKLHEKRVQAGRKLAYRAQLAGDRCRVKGKTLKVVSFPQGEESVPSIRVAGKWLARFGFNLGNEVVLTAADGHILITRKESEGNGGPLV